MPEDRSTKADVVRQAFHANVTPATARYTAIYDAIVAHFLNDTPDEYRLINDLSRIVNSQVYTDIVAVKEAVEAADLLFPDRRHFVQRRATRRENKVVPVGNWAVHPSEG